MQVIQIGSFAILLKWLLLGLSILFGLILIKLWLRKTQENGIHKKIFDLLTNGLFIGFFIWKGSLLILEPTLVVKSPLSLLYFTGGRIGLFWAILGSIIFIFYRARKLTIPHLFILQSGFLFSFAVISCYHILALLFLNDDNKMTHIILALFAVIIVFLSLSKQRIGSQKKIFSTIILFSFLSIFLSFDFTSSPTEAKKTVQENQGVDHKTVKIGVEEGKKAPNFQLQTVSGKEMKLSDLKGKKVILNLWATWCPPCKAEMPHMQEFYQEQERKNVEIVAVNLTTAEKDPSGVEKFVKDYGLTFPVLLDSSGQIGDTYQAFTIPTSYIIDANGIIHKKIVGPMDKEMMNELINSID
ncbi:membrane-associated thiol-disulfide oxidoreductase [Neobacillus bataviensis LMG 21833]|uniref:Membrane-associated thiol-disulfide oxidoreductase n=1 Tax=Neobacillus bataviensis LMG 21833 TaxID=1117379 RepID=K6E9K9_9BACI|nr:redoxin domain-containing protein [Neobacillus bataviensis]EKN70036.1 membrane-associated thiol-disulfide oxidoreductase [Neobacillus bataviensis LMG 21833]